MSPLRILLIGSGGREHAIAKALKLSKHSTELVIFGTHENPGLIPLAHSYSVLDICNVEKVTKQALVAGPIDFAVIGPEAPLQKGLADALWSYNIPVVGPNQNHAQIETSKYFTRQLLYQAGLHAASPGWIALSEQDYENNEEHREFLVNYLENGLDNQYVIKADGLRGGKGVKLSQTDLKTSDEAINYCFECLDRDGCVVIEEKLVGEEFSLISLCDGVNLKHCPPVQDYKKAWNHDAGPNTGGMGSIILKSHSFPFLSKDDIAQAQRYNEAVFKELDKRFRDCHDPGSYYRGVLYGSFMKTSDNRLKVIEYNARFGDPEVINLLALLEDDLVEVFYQMCKIGFNNKEPLRFRNQHCLVKYVCPQGYPINPVKNRQIDLSDLDHVALNEGLIFASIGKHPEESYPVMLGSRALAISVIGESLEDVFYRANSICQKIRGPTFYREDIGEKFLKWDSKQQNQEITYQDAGVNVEEANQAVNKIRELVESTHQGTNIIPNYGHYGGLINLPNNNGIIVSSIDGIGTKVQAILWMIDQMNLSPNERRVRRLQAFESMGRDIFNNNVGDLICVARDIQPLYFLDYFSTQLLDQNELYAFVKGVTHECRLSGYALLGGETAELRDFERSIQINSPRSQYNYEMIGSITGCIQFISQLYIDSNIQPGDLVIGLESSGPHTNGYTLINELIRQGLLDGYKWYHLLSAPHINYDIAVKAIIDHYGIEIKGLAHITGGGFEDNPRRILPDYLDIEWYNWEWPEVFRAIQQAGNISNEEMYRTFNCGVGMIMVIAPEELDKLPLGSNDVHHKGMVVAGRVVLT